MSSVYGQKDHTNLQKHSLKVGGQAIFGPDMEWDVQYHRGKQSDPKPNIFPSQAFPFVRRSNIAPILAR